MRKIIRCLVVSVLLAVACYSARAQQDIAFVIGGHSLAISHTVIAPDGQTVATASEDSTVKIWDVERGTLLRTLQGHLDVVLSVAFSPNGRYVASGGADSTVRIWPVDGSDSMRILGRYAGAINTLVWLADGRIIAGCNDGTIVIRESVTGIQVASFVASSGSVRRVIATPDGELIIALVGAVGKYERADSAKIWRGSGDTLLRIIPADDSGFDAIALSPDFSRIACAEWGKVRLVDTRTAEVIDSLTLDYQVVDISFRADGTSLAIITSRGFVLRDLSTGSIIDSGSNTSWLESGSLLLLPDQRTFVVGGTERRGGPMDNYPAPVLEVRSLEGGDVVRGIQGHPGPVVAVEFRKEGRSFLSSSMERIMTADAVAVALHPLSVGQQGSMISEDGEFYATTWFDIERSTSGSVNFYSADGRGIGYVSGLFNPGLGLIAPGGRSAIYTDYAMLLWDSTTNRSTRHRNQGRFYSFDGARLAGVMAGSIGVWELRDSIPLMSFAFSSDVNDLAFSRDGSLLASGHADGTITVWNLNSRLVLTTFGGHDGPVSAVTFSRNGRFIVSAGIDSTVRVWRIETGDEVYLYDSYPSAQLSVSISADSKFIASGAADGSVIVWDVQGGPAGVDDGNPLPPELDLGFAP